MTINTYIALIILIIIVTIIILLLKFSFKKEIREVEKMEQTNLSLKSISTLISKSDNSNILFGNKYIQFNYNDEVYFNQKLNNEIDRTYAFDINDVSKGCFYKKVKNNDVADLVRVIIRTKKFDGAILINPASKTYVINNIEFDKKLVDNAFKVINTKITAVNKDSLKLVLINKKYNLMYQENDITILIKEVYDGKDN